jgi:hypothetical protein
MKTLKLKQLVVAPFGTETSMTYSTLGLGTDGVVYRRRMQGSAQGAALR